MLNTWEKTGRCEQPKKEYKNYQQKKSTKPTIQNCFEKPQKNF